MKKVKKALVLLLVFVFIMNSTSLIFSATNNYIDVPSTHWASKVIAKWSGDGYGVLQGDGNGYFFPSKGITLGELAAILSKSFGYTERVEAEVIPLWADEPVEKAIAADIIEKADKIDASKTVSREQAIKYIAVAYNIAPIEGETTFADNQSIDSEYKPYVNAFQKSGYIVGKGNNIFDPKAVYTRAEAMQVIENTTSEITDNSVSDETYEKSLIIRKSGVTVKNTTVKENLIVGQGVGDGEVTLDNVTINGALIVYGGGSDSIKVIGGNPISSTVVNKPFGEAVHLDGDFDTVIVSEGSKVIITGKVASLIILGNAEVTLTDASVNNIDINGENVKLSVEKGSTVQNVNVNASKVVISGDGIVKSVIVTEKAKNGVEVLTVPTKISVDAKAGAVKTKNNGEIQPGKTIITSNSTSSHSGSGNSDKGGSEPKKTPTSQPIPTPTPSKNDLPDEIKEILGLDKTKDDTDGDGLKDFFEFSYLTTDLLLVDTDENGISDADEDFDGDGLTNIQEQELGTRPDKWDTDGDGLSDGEEVNIYGTDPLSVDTDGDGLTDYEEIKLGLNPNKVKTDDTTPDNEKEFYQVASDTVKDDALLNSDNWLVPSISGNVPGDISKNVFLEKSDSYIFEDNRAVLSDVINVYTSYEVPLTLSFTYSQAYTGDLRNLTIVSFGEDGLEIIDTDIDEDEKVISGEITGSGMYFVIDLDEFLKGLGIDVFANIESDESLTESFSVLDMKMDRIQITQDDFDYFYDNEGNVIEQREKYSTKSGDLFSTQFAMTSPLTQSINTFSVSSNATGKADIVFVIDTTGSMSSAIAGVKNNINIFADKLVNEYNVDANFSLIEFRDITVDGVNSTKLHKNMTSNWFTNVNSFKSNVNTLTVNGGGDTPETPIDGLEMARRLDWRGDATKFIVLVTDAGFKTNNSYGISNMNEMVSLLVNDGIIVSVIASSKSNYALLTDETGGLFGYINGNFSDILLQLADKVGKTTNEGGEWVFLNDFQAVKLSDALANASTNDTDKDGLTDAQELGESIEKDMMPYIRSLINRYEIPEEYYTGKTKITVWNYISNPVLLDTDYDGIPDGKKDYDGKTVTPDPFPKSNSFVGKLYWKEGKHSRESTENIEFVVDYSLLFKSNTVYKKDLAVLTSLYVGEIYDNTYLKVTRGITGGSDDPTAFCSLFGLKDVEDIDINGSDYGVDVDDCSEFVIGHRSVTYKGLTKEIIVVIVRGTNGTNTEWSSNFDVGADISEYYNATGYSHPHWKNKNNHKGFDVAANRIIEKIDDYLSRHSLTSGQRVMLITGHSRGGGIANLLGAYYEKDPNFTSFTYTFAGASSTTDSNAENYKTIFNIVNEDDIIPYLPLSTWGFKKYGIVKSISVQDHYENKWGKAQKGTWEWLTGDDYNNDRGTQRTLNTFKKIASNRNELYILDSSSDGKVWENNLGHTTYAGAERELQKLTDTLKNEKLLRFCKLSIVGGGFLQPYHVEINYCPAYFMQMLANMASDPTVGPMTGHDVKGKYAKAKASFIASSGAVVIGGMTHPHLTITYYLIVYNNFIDRV